MNIKIPTNKEKSDHYKILTKMGGNASAKSRFKDMSKEQISEKMSEIRLKRLKDTFLDGLNKANKQKDQF